MTSSDDCLGVISNCHPFPDMQIILYLEMIFLTLNFYYKNEWFGSQNVMSIDIDI